MSLCDFRKEFRRSYLRYLLDEVIVEPLDSFSIITFTLGAIHLVKGEEAKIPRWLAKILAERNKVRIKGYSKEDIKNLITELLNYSKGFIDEPIDPSIYMRIYDILTLPMEEDMRTRLLRIVRAFIEVRQPKVLMKVLNEDSHEIIWEDVLFKVVKKCLDEWSNILFEKH